MSPIHLRVKELRLANKLSLRALAHKAGISPATIVEIEAGRTERVAFDVLEALADALGVNAALLVEHTPQSTKRR